MKLLKKLKSFKSHIVLTIYFFGILFSTILIWNNTLHTASNLNWNTWAFYEWLINYQGGFVRRGLIGWIINAFYYDEELIALNALVFFTALLFILLATLFVAKNVNAVRSALLFIFCPVGLYWMAASNEFYFRKEIFFYIFILIACLIFQKWQITGNRFLSFILTGFIFVASVFLPLIHEAFIFYGWLIFALMLFQLHKSDGKSSRRIVMAYSVLCLFIFAVLSYYKGDLDTSEAIWLSLSYSARDLTANPEHAGGISAIGWSLKQGLFLPIVALQTGLASYYFFSIVLVYLFLGYIVSEHRGLSLKQTYLSNWMLLPFGVVTASFLPLFVLGYDWGRWVMGIWYVSLFIFLLQLDKQIIQFFTNKVKILQKVFYLFSFPILLGFGLFTRVPECCFSGSGTSLLFNPAFAPVKNFLKYLLSTL